MGRWEFQSQTGGGHGIAGRRWVILVSRHGRGSVGRRTNKICHFGHVVHTHGIAQHAEIRKRTDLSGRMGRWEFQSQTGGGHGIAERRWVILVSRHGRG